MRAETEKGTYRVEKSLGYMQPMWGQISIFVQTAPHTYSYAKQIAKLAQQITCLFLVRVKHVPALKLKYTPKRSTF